MFIIGLTGNIATGKSTVTTILGELGAEIIDSDMLVHELYGPGSEVTRKVATLFGPQVLNEDGSVNREILGQMAFADSERLRQLEKIVWPAVAALRDERIQRSTARVIVVDAVKLIESSYASRCDSVWLVVANPDVQLRRLMERSGMTAAKAGQRLSSQPDSATKKKRADVLIENNDTMHELRDKVLAAWNQTVPKECRT